LGIEYEHALNIHDYVFLKSDKYAKIGHKTYDNGAFVWRWTKAPLSIGKYCSIANNVRFIVDEGFHNSSEITGFPLVNNLFKNSNTLPNGDLKSDFLKNLKQREGITIGNDVWIGMNTVILSGVTIGNGVTIAANSVVTKDIPDYSIVGGNPAKVIRLKHNEQTIAEFNKIKWWDWDDPIVKERILDFYGPASAFVRKYSKR
jgi:virginiamycin A acetyltransferase